MTAVSCQALFVLACTTQVLAQETIQPAAALLASETPAMTFAANGGQWPIGVRFAGRSGAGAVWFHDDGWTLRFSGSESHGPLAGNAPDATSLRRQLVLRMTLEGGLGQPIGVDTQPGHQNYYLGSDPRHWAERVPSFASLRYEQIRPGVGVVVRPTHSFFAYDLLLAADVDLEEIIVRCDGVDGLRVAPDGTLRMESAIGEVHQTVPVAWYEHPDGSREPVRCGFRVLRGHRYGFALQAPRQRLPLVIDPGISWSSNLGGTGNENVWDMEAAPGTEVTLAGHTTSLDFPTTMGAHSSANAGQQDAYIARLDPSRAGMAQIVWATYFGGEQEDIAYGVHADPSGALSAITGYTLSANMATLNPLAGQSTLQGPSDAFFAQFDGQGALLFASYLGGWDRDVAIGLDALGLGDYVVTGTTTSDSRGSSQFPTTPGTPAFGGGFDVFVTRIQPAGNPQIPWSRFLGGSGNEGPFTTFNRFWARAVAVAVDDAGRIAVTSGTGSTDFPTTPRVLQSSRAGGFDSFLTVFDSGQTGTPMVYSTYFGGVLDDWAIGLAPHPAGGFVVSGGTFGTFPTTPGAWQPMFVGPPGAIDAYIAWLDPGLTGANQLRYSTHVGTPPGNDFVTDLVVEAGGIVNCCGATLQQFPTTPGSFQPNSMSFSDNGFVARFDFAGRGADDLLYASYVGGSAVLNLNAIVVDENGIATMAGAVFQGTVMTPLVGGLPRAGGLLEAVLVRSDLLPGGADRLPPSTPACAGPIYCGVFSQPARGTANFGVYAVNAPPNAFGALFFGGPAAGPVQPSPLPGATVLITGPYIGVTTMVAAVGRAEWRQSIPNGIPLGSSFHVQWAFANTPSCTNAGFFSASERLDLTIQ